ncbi:MAG TPA: radical SAM protein [Vicinamibacteria bacterium]|nr:radical SAM protein [Vicinamibacteria bacterium]
MKTAATGLGLLGARFLRHPFYVRVHVTHRCNYRCGMCAVPGRADRPRELPLDAVRTVARRLRQLGARHVVLTGGEPFLRRDLPEIVAAFDELGFSVRIQTNGGPQVTRQALAAVAAAGADDLSVSVDTLDAELQDRICGRRGALEHALRTLALSAALMPRGMSLANIVASRHNFRQLPELVTFFSERGIYTYITPVMVHPPAEEPAPDFRFRAQDESFAFGDVAAEERDTVVDRLIRLRRAGAGLTNSSRHLQDFRRFLSDRQCRWPCEAGRLSLDVLPDGQCSVCKEKPPLASVLDPAFLATFRSAAFRERCAAITSACPGCFYGEYREPYYAARKVGVLAEWVRDWLQLFHRGMAWNARRQRLTALGQSPSRSIR